MPCLMFWESTTPVYLVIYVCCNQRMLCHRSYACTCLDHKLELCGRNFVHAHVQLSRVYLASTLDVTHVIMYQALSDLSRPLPSRREWTWEGVCTVGSQVCYFPVEGNEIWEGVCTVGSQVCHFPVKRNGTWGETFSEEAQEMRFSQFEGAYSASWEVPPLYQCYHLLNDWSTLRR